MLVQARIHISVILCQANVWIGKDSYIRFDLTISGRIMQRSRRNGFRLLNVEPSIL